MTHIDRYETRLDLANDKLIALQRQAAAALNLDTQPIFVAALGDLATALEELHVVAEELNERNAELLAMRAALDLERQHYQDLFEFAPDGYLVTSIEGVIVEANRAMADLLGVRANFLVGKPLVVYVAEADRPRLHASLTQLKGSQVARRWEMSLQPRHDEAHPVAVQVAASRDALGRVRFLRWMIQDITERQQVEMAYRQSETRAQAMLRAIPDLMFRLNRQGVFLDYKADISDLYVQANPIGLRNRDIAPPDFADLIDRQIRLALQTGTLQTFEYQLPIPGRGVRDYEARMMASGSDEVTAIVRDVTDRKRAEEALRQSEQRYHAVSDLITDFAFAFQIKPDGTSLKEFATGLLDRIIDETAHDEGLVGLARLIVPEDQAVIESMTAAILAGQRLVPFEFRIKYNSDEIHWVQGNLRIEWDEMASRIVRILGAGSDITERKQVEEALKLSTQRYRSLFEDSPISLWEEDFSEVKHYLDSLRQSGITNLRSYLTQHPEAVNTCAALVKVLDVNQATLALLEVTDKATLFAQLNHTLAIEAHVPFRDELCTLAEGAQHWVLDEVQQTATGRELFITVHVAIAPGYADTWSKVLVSILDITERKRMEGVLRESQHIMAGILNAVPVRVFWKDLQLDYLGCNAAFAQDAGFIDPIDIIGKDDFQLGWRDQADLYRRDDRQVIESGYPKLLLEEQLTTSAGETITLLTSKVPLRNAQGKISGVLGAYIDITKRKRAEVAEREQRQLAEALRDTAAVLNSTLRLDEVLDRILSNVESVVAHDTANLMLIEDGVARIARHRGYEERGLVDFAARVRLTVADVPNLQHMVDTGQPRVMPNVRLEPDWIDWPESHWIQSIASAPIRLKDTTIGFINLNSGTPNFYSSLHGERLQVFANQVAVAVENARLYEQIQSHSHQLEERVRERTVELQTVNVRLTELDQLKDEFLSRISHELRTPLAGILIALELLETAKPEKRERFMLRLKQSTYRMRNMIEDVLMFAELNRYTQPSMLEALDLNHLIKSQLTQWQTVDAGRELQFELNLARDLPQIRTDGELMMQAISRLVTNAINYTPMGTVTVSTARADEAERNWVTISVADTGPGITSADLPHIFDRFYRGRAAADYKTPGTGIGLSISREIVERLGGRLTVETQVGVGSTFTLWLPGAIISAG